MSGTIIFIMGVSGSGKTVIGQSLSKATGIPFFDGDDLHSAANKEKMHAGRPLTDEDRKEWLVTINNLAKREGLKKGAIIACSALKEKYRSQLSDDITSGVHWIFLQGDYNLIRQRINDRKDHFMPVSLLGSQFEILEIPHHALTVDIKNTPGAIVDNIINKLNLQRV